MVKNTDFYTFFGFLNGGLSFLWTFIVNVSQAFLTVFPWRFPPSPWNLRQDAQLVADRLSTVPRIRRGAWKGSRSAAREDDILIHGYGSIPMKIPFLVGWTSINPSYFDVNYRGTRFWHTATFSWEWNSWNSWKYGMKIWEHLRFGHLYLKLFFESTGCEFARAIQRISPRPPWMDMSFKRTAAIHFWVLDLGWYFCWRAWWELQLIGELNTYYI